MSNQQPISHSTNQPTAQSQSAMQSPIPPEMQGQQGMQGQGESPPQIQGQQTTASVQGAQSHQQSPPGIQEPGQQGAQVQVQGQQSSAQSQEATSGAMETAEEEVSAQAAANLYTYGKYVYVGANTTVWNSFDLHTSYSLFSVSLTPYSLYGYFKIDERRAYKTNSTTVRNYSLIRNFGSSGGWVWVRYLYGN